MYASAMGWNQIPAHIIIILLIIIFGVNAVSDSEQHTPNSTAVSRAHIYDTCDIDVTNQELLTHCP
jgi:hypothetical protein